MGICFTSSEMDVYYKLQSTITTCPVCSKTISQQHSFICKHCHITLGHKSCMRYHIIIHPRCTYCKEIL